MHTGQELDLPPDSEELAGWFAALLETEHAADEVFQKNFFADWQVVLKKHPPVRIYLIPFSQWLTLYPAQRHYHFRFLQMRLPAHV